jgi:DNA-binding transcriptional regulator GbsR (MarR family)
MTDHNVQLSASARRFVLHWGEMGDRWGVNRTVAQIHALLYITGRPLDAEQIAAALGVARSNVSTSLRELQGWGLARVVHAMGDRRDRYETLDDVWEMFRIVMDERLKREIEPTLRVLQECVAEAERARASEERDRLAGMLDFFRTATSCYAHLRLLPPGALAKLARLGPRLSALLGVPAGKSARH